MALLPSQKLSIKSWSEEDRPREKLILKGRHNLSNAELIAILLGSGSREASAVELAKILLRDVEEDLDKLGKKDLKSFLKYKGIGEAKAVSIIAALELGRRRSASGVKKKIKITSSDIAYQEILPFLQDLSVEEFWIILVDRANQILLKERISIGGVSSTLVDPKMLFKVAIENLASGIILVHNHPSGNLKPSQADIKLTQKIADGAKLMDISILDHLIVTDHGYFSFADEDLMPR